MRKYLLPYRVLILSLISILLLQYCVKQENYILFPEREVINKQSEFFFDNVLIGLPQLKAIPFFVKSKNYFSAYIKLSRVLSKTPYFIDIVEIFERMNVELIENFNSLKQVVKKDNYIELKKNMKYNDFNLYFLLLHKLFNDYNENKLSGSIAYNYWNIILDISNKILNKPQNKWEDFAILNVSSKIFFFKSKEKYKNKSVKIKKNIKEKYTDEFLKYIIEKGDK